MGRIPIDKAGIGSAMNDTNRQIGVALGVAVLGTVMNSSYISQIKASQLIATLPENIIDPIETSIQSAHKVAQNIADPGLSQAVVNLSGKAFTSGMVDAMFVGGIIMATEAIVI